MAKTEQEIRGKVGNMVFYKMGSETRVRSTASDFQDADSEGQRSGRSRLRVATLFPDFVNAYPKNHLRTTVQYVDVVS